MHLAQAFGGYIETPSEPSRETSGGVETVPEPQGWRSAREVVAFLRSRGAKFRALEARVEGDWAALSSEGEGYDSEGVSMLERDDIVWVPPSRQ